MKPGMPETGSKILLGDCAEELKKLESDSVDALVTDPPAGIGFMSGGKKDHWDSDKGGRDEWIAWLQSVMEEAKRVMKPGAHGLVWSLPRTSHWTGTALENAGFEVRDCIYHVFGSGFPKSHDISKAIDKMKGATREVVGTKLGQPGYSLTDGLPGGVAMEGNVDGSLRNGEAECAITAPATDEPRQWDGWGTALKPAVECWWLVRKPCSEKTVAENVLKWGTGAINIDGSRVPTTDKVETVQGQSSAQQDGEMYQGKDQRNKKPFTLPAAGRFPSHLIHDGSEEVLSEFAKAGVSKVPGSYESKTMSVPGQNGTMGKFKRELVHYGFGDEGTPARFFYCTKASRSEKGPDTKHPTVKSLKLMRYLIKLITPPNGTVLDPFAGSGSTLIAAKQLGRPFIGIEREEEYVKIAQARLDAVKPPIAKP